MKLIERVSIDWNKTGRLLRLLRCANENLRRNVCKARKIMHSACKNADPLCGKNCQINCSRDCDLDCNLDCENCGVEIDNAISRAELAEVLCVSATQVANWELGRTPPPIEDLLMYGKLCGLNIFDILIFDNKAN